MGTLIIISGSIVLVAAGIGFGLYLYTKNSRRRTERRGSSRSVH